MANGNFLHCDLRIREKANKQSDKYNIPKSRHCETPFGCYGLPASRSMASQFPKSKMKPALCFLSTTGRMRHSFRVISRNLCARSPSLPSRVKKIYLDREQNDQAIEASLVRPPGKQPDRPCTIQRYRSPFYFRDRPRTIQYASCEFCSHYKKEAKPRYRRPRSQSFVRLFRSHTDPYPGS